MKKFETIWKNYDDEMKCSKNVLNNNMVDQFGQRSNQYRENFRPYQILLTNEV